MERERDDVRQGHDEEPDELPELPELPPEAMEDEQTVDLVQRAQDGDSEALNDLFAKYHAVMVEVARRRLGPRLRMKEDPDDLAQTTFREATRDFATYRYRGKGSLLRWLIQILQNKIRDKAEFYSAGKRNTALETALEAERPGAEERPRIDPASSDLSVTRQVQRDENWHLLHEALKDLPPDYHRALTLVIFEGLSLREAGERLGGRSEDAVRMMMRRAEAKLRTRLRAADAE